jgi:hypothetical protein
MKTKEEIKKYSDELAKTIANEMNFYDGFSPEIYDDIKNKFNELKGKYKMLNEINSQKEIELIDLLKAKKHQYRDNDQNFQLKGEIIALKWIIDNNRKRM